MAPLYRTRNALAALAGTAVLYAPAYDIANAESSAVELRALAQAEVAVGASSQRVEEFYQRHGVRYVWEPADRTYWGIADTSDWTFVRVNFRLDDQGTVKDRRIYTGNRVTLP